MIPPTHSPGKKSITMLVTSWIAAKMIVKNPPDLLRLHKRYPAIIFRTVDPSRIMPMRAVIQKAIPATSPMIGVAMNEAKIMLDSITIVPPTMPIAPKIKDSIAAAVTAQPLCRGIPHGVGG